MPTSKDLSHTQLAVLACKYLSPTNLKRVPTHNQLVKFVSDRRQTSNPMVKSATTIEDLVLTDALKKTEDGEMFLLHDNGQEVKDRIIATQQPKTWSSVTSDKLLMTMITEKPQLQDSNHETLWAARRFSGSSQSRS
ncbi:hypothetical protein DSO57_1006193 [Entomophthora muscae]|uniref:Uncharacterized protein n=1 Tax=Entomophthora muscae TaxID=34485 RepID=A0ACC2RMF7_9FUNG|nr:hypothetical protein DSO57_1006193 [Entomophthora muscae]